MKIKLRFYCNDHGYVPAGFGTAITDVNFNQHDEIGLWCPICHKARPMIVEMFTTIIDRKGVEIYVGDIVEIIHPAWIERCEVIFDRGSFTLRQIRAINGQHSFVRMSAVELWPEVDNWKLEVVGNIHE